MLAAVQQTASHATWGSRHGSRSAVKLKGTQQRCSPGSPSAASSMPYWGVYMQLCSNS